MIITRPGIKSRVASDLVPLFPYHNTWIEPFFGAGGIFFNKTKSRQNLVNDSDSDVYNLFTVVLSRKEELLDAYQKLPVHQGLLDHWKVNQEKDPILKALRFIFLSNFTYLGKQDTILFKPSRPKDRFYKYLDLVFTKLDGVIFDNSDFRIFLNRLSFPEKDFGKPSVVREESFLYADPPWLGAVDTYEHSWKEQDLLDLIDQCLGLGVKFAISEAGCGIAEDILSDRGLTIHRIGDKQMMKRRPQEILATNYNQIYKNQYLI